MNYFVTGAAGFIGFHTSVALLERGHKVFGFDNLNHYYDPKLKQHRLDLLNRYPRFSCTQGNLENKDELSKAWETCQPDYVVHLGAQAGVRYSIEVPEEYVTSNLVGFQNVIELVRRTKPKNFLYASSSSVYGSRKNVPFRETDDCSKPISFYAATKLSNELVAKTYSHLFDIPSTGLRFFTVYGPYGRPDMAIFSFTRAILRGEPIKVFNHGKMIRDFTYIDDIVAGILGALAKPSKGTIYNLGKGHPDTVMELIAAIEHNTGKKAIVEMMPIQPGDVEQTLADIAKAREEFGYQPKTGLREGVANFVRWYKLYNSLS